MYQSAIRLAELEGTLELKISAVSLFEMSFILLEWSRHIINMLLYEYGKILTLVSIAVTLGKLVSRQC